MGKRVEKDRSLPGFDDRSLPDRYCDLVLTGGVTSAAAYFGAIHGLAQAYRFNSIGGSSSGAGAAALAGAAEYRRRHGSNEGFRTLLRRTWELKEVDRGKTRLRHLFQPDPWSKRLFNALLPTFAGPNARVSKLLLRVGQHYWASWLPAILITAVIGFGIGARRDPLGCLGWGLATVLTSVIFGICVMGWRIWRDIVRAVDCDYGLCSGQQAEPGAKHPPLTLWLHELLQDVAGLPLSRPLTFADLRDAPAGPRETLGDASPAGARSIDLRMFSSDVTQGRPLMLPIGDDEDTDQGNDNEKDKDERRLFFRPRELRRLFPAEVVNAMMTPLSRRQSGSAAATIEPKRGPEHVSLKGHLLRISRHLVDWLFITPDWSWLDPAVKPIPEEEDLWEFPGLGLPIVVAARMSVSFPILLSAVPLWQRVPGGKQFRRLLFADGGICSNFPIHLFDNPIPAWPTFGVALFDGGGAYSLDPECIANRVNVPQTHLERRSDRSNNFDQHGKPLNRLLGFISAMFTTVKDWNDALLSELPGVRERIAEVALPKDIGGLNLRMKPDQIEYLALLGGEVARKLLARYAVPDGRGGQAPGWRDHRWVRFNVLTQCLQQTMVGLSRSAQHARYAEPLRDQIRSAIDEPPLGGKCEPMLQPAQAAALERTLDALLQIERALTPRPIEQPYKPTPMPEWRIRPPM